MLPLFTPPRRRREWLHVALLDTFLSVTRFTFADYRSHLLSLFCDPQVDSHHKIIHCVHIWSNLKLMLYHNYDSGDSLRSSQLSLWLLRTWTRFSCPHVYQLPTRMDLSWWVVRTVYFTLIITSSFSLPMLCQPPDASFQNCECNYFSFLHQQQSAHIKRGIRALIL